MRGTLERSSVVFLGVLMLSSEFGCAFREGTQSKNSPSVATPAQLQPIAAVQQWDDSFLAKGNAKLQVKSLKPEFRGEIKKRFKVPELVEVKSEYAGNYSLYRIPNLEQANNMVFIQPKLFVFGTAQGGNVLTIASTDRQQVTLTIPMSYIDGLKPMLTSYEGHDPVSLPKSLIIPDVAALKEDLRKQLGAEIQLQALPACPRELSLVHIRGAKNERYRLVPTVPIQARCPMNEFFTASMSSSRDEVTELIENALDTGLSVQILSQFRVEYRHPVAVYTLDLNPIGTYAKVREKFVSLPFGQGAEPAVYLSQQLVTPLQKLLISEIEQTGVSTAWVPYSQGVNALEDAYFDDVTGSTECPGGQRCFRVKRETEVNFNGPITLMWTEDDTLGASDLIPIVTLVKGLDESYPFQASNQRVLPVTTVVPSLEACQREGGNIPGCPGFSCEKFKDNAYCRKGNTKAAISQFQVFPGAKLKIAMNRMTEWRYELSTPREDTPLDQKKGVIKCAHSQAIPGACAEYKTRCPKDLIDFCAQPEDKCDQEKKIYENHCTDNAKSEKSCGFLGLGSCSVEVKSVDRTCQQVETGSFCERYKTTCKGEVTKVCPVEQITECVKPALECEQYTTEFYSKYTYSEPWVNPRSLDLHKGEGPEQLWEGLDIEFTSLKVDGSGYDRVTCPILAFPHWLDGNHSITLSLSNQISESCQPFNDDNRKEGRWPSIALINRISFDRTYQCGSLEWTHAVDSSSEQHTRDTMIYSCPATGQRSNFPVSAIYQPIVDLEGTVSLLGRSMNTISSQRK